MRNLWVEFDEVIQALTEVSKGQWSKSKKQGGKKIMENLKEENVDLGTVGEPKEATEDEKKINKTYKFWK